MKKQGFTLAEMVITLGVIAFIAVAVLGVLKNIVPNHEQVMLKKAYYLAGRVVNELVNDDEIYPVGENTGNYLANTNEGVKNGVTYKGNKKFCEAFASIMNINGDVKCTQHSFTAGKEPKGTLTTTDGMVWELPITSFGGNNANADKWEDIIVDVNGAKGGNCFYGQKVGEEDCANPDRFVIQVNYLGKFNIPDSLARAYLNKTSTQDNFRTVANKLANDGNVVTYIPKTTLAEHTSNKFDDIVTSGTTKPHVADQMIDDDIRSQIDNQLGRDQLNQDGGALQDILNNGATLYQGGGITTGGTTLGGSTGGTSSGSNNDGTSSDGSTGGTSSGGSTGGTTLGGSTGGITTLGGKTGGITTIGGKTGGKAGGTTTIKKQ